MPLTRARERLLRRIATRRGREKEGIVLVEGPRALATALAAGAEFDFVMLLEGAPLPEGLASLLVPRGVDVVELSPAELREHSRTESPQGVAAVAREPRVPLPAPEKATGSTCLVLDGVQDPGNAGTLIRAAAAFGTGRVLALDGTVDVWNPKAVRASAGTAFHLPVHRLPWEEAVAWLDAAGIPLLVGDAGGRDVRAWSDRAPEPSGWALLVGNEAAGPRAAAAARASASLAIPLASGVDSLNVAMAGTVLLWALGPGRATPSSRTTDASPERSAP